MQEFKEWCFDQGIVNQFSNSVKFRQRFESQFQINLNSHPYLAGIIRENADAIANNPTVAELSNHAKELLVCAANDQSGHLLFLSLLSGRHIQTNGRTFGDPNDARSSAAWESALNELISLHYLIGRGVKGESFQVTDAGYKRADLIRLEQ